MLFDFTFVQLSNQHSNHSGHMIAVTKKYSHAPMSWCATYDSLAPSRTISFTWSRRGAVAEELGNKRR